MNKKVIAGIVLVLVVLVLGIALSAVNGEMPSSASTGAEQQADGPAAQIKALLPYEATVRIMGEEEGRLTIHLTPAEQNADRFGEKIVYGVWATDQVISEPKAILHIPGEEVTFGRYFVTGDEDYGTFFDDRSGETEVHRLGTPLDLCDFYPDVYLDIVDIVAAEEDKALCFAAEEAMEQNPELDRIQAIAMLAPEYGLSEEEFRGRALSALHEPLLIYSDTLDTTSPIPFTATHENILTTFQEAEGLWCDIDIDAASQYSAGGYDVQVLRLACEREAASPYICSFSDAQSGDMAALIAMSETLPESADSILFDEACDTLLEAAGAEGASVSYGYIYKGSRPIAGLRVYCAETVPGGGLDDGRLIFVTDYYSTLDPWDFMPLAREAIASGTPIDFGANSSTEENEASSAVATDGASTPMPTPSPDPTPAPTQAATTSGQRSALQDAKSYLRSMPFSKEGLIDQLEYEGYTLEEAQYAVDNCGADWMEQALENAKDYLRIMAFSKEGLIEQLEYEGYTVSEAEYAAENCGADWMEQAAEAAKSYLDVMSFSREGLIEQLEYEGFTAEQAEYGASAVGY